MGKENKAVITAALAGARASKEQNPAVPYGAQEIIEDAVKCYNSGAAVVHIHVRDHEGRPGTGHAGRSPGDLSPAEKMIKFMRMQTDFYRGKRIPLNISVSDFSKPGCIISKKKLKV